MNDRADVFVTGGSGFIGGALVRRLVGEGRRVRALARSRASAEVVERLGAEPVPGDLADPASIAAGAAGCGLAVHLAAHVGQWGTREDFLAGNVTGTENALAGCREAGVSRFVHCGTEAALIAGEPLRSVDETAPLRPDSKALYSQTKAMAELAVRAANADGFETVVVRPRLVWGKGDTTLLPAIVDARPGGTLRLDRRRRSPHVHDPRRQRDRGPPARRRARPRRGGLLRHGRRSGGVPRVRLRAARDPGRRAADPLGPRPRGRRRRRGLRDGLAAAAPGWRAAADAARGVAVLAGVHDRDHEGARRARLRARALARRRLRRAARRASRLGRARAPRSAASRAGPRSARGTARRRPRRSPRRGRLQARRNARSAG